MSVQSIAPNAPSSAIEVYYNNVRLSPNPLIDYTVEPQFDDTGHRLENKTRLTLTGSVLILPSGSYEQLYIKQTDFRNLFASDYKDFIILAGPANRTLPSGTVISSGLKPKVVSLNISSDVHVSRFDYTVDLEDLVTVSGVSGATSSLTNQWSFKENSDNCTLEITHNVSADGPDGAADKFQQALKAVKQLTGIDKLPIDLPYFTEPNASGLYGFIHPSNPAGGPVFELSVSREETADVANGSYSVTEVFTLVSGVPFFFTSHNESYQEDVNGIVTVTVDGTVQGLGRTMSPSFGAEGGFGFARAASGFINVVKPRLPYDASGIYLRHKGIVASGLNITSPTSFSVTENKCKGTVGFSISYTDNPAAFVPSGIVSRQESVSITNGIRVYATHAIPFRRLGNLLQDIRTTSEGQISIQCQAQAKNTGNQKADTNRAIQYVQDELNRLRNIHANSSNFITLRVGSVEQQVSDVELNCSATVSYIFTVDLANVLSPTSDITLRMLP